MPSSRSQENARPPVDGVDYRVPIRYFGYFPKAGRGYTPPRSSSAIVMVKPVPVSWDIPTFPELKGLYFWPVVLTRLDYTRLALIKRVRHGWIKPNQLKVIFHLTKGSFRSLLLRLKQAISPVTAKRRGHRGKNSRTQYLRKRKLRFKEDLRKLRREVVKSSTEYMLSTLPNLREEFLPSGETPLPSYSENPSGSSSSLKRRPAIRRKINTYIRVPEEISAKAQKVPIPEGFYPHVVPEPRSALSAEFLAEISPPGLILQPVQSLQQLVGSAHWVEINDYCRREGLPPPHCDKCAYHVWGYESWMPIPSTDDQCVTSPNHSDFCPDC